MTEEFPFLARLAQTLCPNAGFGLTPTEVRFQEPTGKVNRASSMRQPAHRKTDVVSKQAVRVDLTDAFPFLVNKLSPYCDR